jgi:hypothetical protein
MEMKDLSKWVNEYNLKFKVLYGPKIGCTVNIFHPGYDRPYWAVKGEDLIEALGEADKLLKRIFKIKLEV